LSQPEPRPTPQPSKARRAALPLLLLTVVVGLVVLGATLFLLNRTPSPTSDPTPQASPTVVAQAGQTAPTSPTAETGNTTPAPTTGISEDAAMQTLDTLNSVKVPPRDLPDVVARLKLKAATSLPRTTEPRSGGYRQGDITIFFVHDIAAKNYYTITARVELVTANAYWYVHTDVPVERAALGRAADLFEESIYPTNTRIFGTEWKPGVDGEPRITVLLASIPNVGGYYSSADEYTRLVNPYSNEREMLYINVGGSWESIADTIAHEHQHMIHWNSAPNHDVWLNEGMAVVAESLNGFGDVGVDEGFMRDPDLQLNAWRSTPGDSLRHYGAAFLFTDFLREHYGGERILRALIGAEGQGIGAVDSALGELNREERFTDVFRAWTLANLLDAEGGAPRELTYPNRDASVRVGERIRRYPAEVRESVAQFGTDYIELLPPAERGSPVTVTFSGAPSVGVVDTKAAEGDHFWWSNRGDVSNTSMTRRFDLRDRERATLEFSAWYDIEEGFDYAYVSASTDGGVTWETLRGKHTTIDNPNGTNLGNAYTGKSSEREGADAGGWVRESIDLTPYANREVVLRFDYVTDDGYNAQGFAVDDITVSEAGYRDGAEEGQGGWEGAGFVRVYEQLPQDYALTAVLFSGEAPEIREIEVRGGEATFTLEGLGTKHSSAILVVSGATPHTLQRAEYTIEVR
jgi:immune inhibitor A